MSEHEPGWLAGYHQALKDAAAECERHAAFCKDEAHKGGAADHLITRAGEANYLAERIRKMEWERAMTDITLEALKLRERELELDAVLIRGRTLEIRQMIEEAQRRRGGRPRKPASVAIIPQRVAGASHEEPADEADAEETAA